MTDLKVVQSGTEADRAAELKKRIIEVYGPVCQLFDEITAAGFVANVQVGPGPVGKFHVTNINIFKPY